MFFCNSISRHPFTMRIWVFTYFTSKDNHLIITIIFCDSLSSRNWDSFHLCLLTSLSLDFHFLSLIGNKGSRAFLSFFFFLFALGIFFCLCLFLGIFTNYITSLNFFYGLIFTIFVTKICMRIFLS